MKAAFLLSPAPFRFRAPPLLALAGIGALLLIAEGVRQIEADVQTLERGQETTPNRVAANETETIAHRLENPFGALIHWPDQPAQEEPQRLARAPLIDIDPENGQIAPPSSEPEPPRGEAADVPLPPRRMPDAPARRANRSQTREAAPAPAPAPDNRNLFERLFNIQPSSGGALAYARSEEGPVGEALRGATQMPMSYADGRTAIYDISAKAVFLPSGEKLEAHSGLGDLLDDPKSVHVKNRGVTPPNIYDLTLRESLFHGVQAIRLNPAPGSQMYGRDGMLAHTYMLGPKGDSNGCVSFKEYDRFLQAYLNGEVKRLVVVTRRT